MGVKLQTTHCLTTCQKFPAGSRLDRYGFSFSQGPPSPFQMNQLCPEGKMLFVWNYTDSQEASATINSLHRRALSRGFILFLLGNLLLGNWFSQGACRSLFTRATDTERDGRFVLMMRTCQERHIKSRTGMKFFCSRIYPALHLPLGLSVILAT